MRLEDGLLLVFPTHLDVWPSFCNSFSLLLETGCSFLQWLRRAPNHGRTSHPGWSNRDLSMELPILEVRSQGFVFGTWLQSCWWSHQRHEEKHRKWDWCPGRSRGSGWRLRWQEMHAIVQWCLSLTSLGCFWFSWNPFSFVSYPSYSNVSGSPFFFWLRNSNQVIKF